MLIFLGLYAVILSVLYGTFASVLTFREIVEQLSVFVVLTVASEKLANFIGRKLYSKTFDPTGRSVFITGCDSGFGNFLSLKLDKLGYQVFAGCLFPDGDGARQLKSSATSKLQIIGVDVTKDDSVAEAARQVRNHLNGRSLSTVVANAGVISVGELEWVTAEDMHKMFDVNVYGVARTVRAFLPLLRESKHNKRIVVTTSLWGRLAFPVAGAYCMSKAAAKAYTDTLRREVNKFNIEVVAIEPNIYRTPLVDKESLAKSVQKSWDQLSEDTKQVYTERYLDETKRYMRFLLESEARTEINEVIDDMVEAVTAVRPLFYYRPDHPIRKVFYKIMAYGPAQAVDLFLQNRPMAMKFRKYSNMW